MIIFITLLFLPEGILSQSVDSNDKAISSVKDNSLENEQNSPIEIEQDLLISSQPKKNPIILEEVEASHKEGIGDAFSQDHRDRFRLEDEKTNKVSPPVQEKPDA